MKDSDADNADSSWIDADFSCLSLGHQPSTLVAFLISPKQTTIQTMNAYALLDDEMVRLDLEADNSSADNLSAFSAAYETIDWNSRPPEDFVRTVKLALRVGAYLIAREAALAGRQRFPKNRELQEIAQVLAPPSAQIVKSKNQDARWANHQWLQQHRNEYSGRWAALDDGTLLGAGDSPTDLMAQINQNQNSDVLLTQIW